MAKEKILVVDDDPEISQMLADCLRSWDYDPVTAETVTGGLAAFDAEQPSAVLLDINLPDGSGLDALREIKRRQPQAVVIMMTGRVLAEETIEALRGGAYDFIPKPINPDELHFVLRNGIEAQRLRQTVGRIQREQARRFSFAQIMGDSEVMKEMIEMAQRVAESEASTVLLQGESGTGKDLVAKAIHYGSRRADKPFVAINCAAIPATLLESELFGHEKGAFTDARARKQGLFEQAEGGTLFLDEIGELELGLQAKLLRVLEEGTFRRVGGLKDLSFDARIIAASNRDLRVESEAGRFRLDLFYRLSVIEIYLPPLRERGDDVIALSNHFISLFNERLRKRVRGLSPEVAEIFRRYRWPGNVRELRNIIERAMILQSGDLVTAAYLPRNLSNEELSVMVSPAAAQKERAPENGGSASRVVLLPDEGIDLDEVERSLVEQAIARTGGNRTRAARLLGISRDRLRYRLKRLARGAARRSAAKTSAAEPSPVSSNKDGV